MKIFEKRKNQKLREDLQQQWLKEVEEKGTETAPIDTQKLWQKIDQSLTRESLTLVRADKARPSQGYWIVLSAAAVLMLSVLGTLRLQNEPKAAPQNETSALDFQLTHANREPLQTPSRMEWTRCDQTRQSCMFMAFL